MTVWITNIDPTSSDRTIVDIDVYVPNGATVEVPDEVAGREPFDEQVNGETVHNLGSGLLAQLNVWRRAEAPPVAGQPNSAQVDTAPTDEAEA